MLSSYKNLRNYPLLIIMWFVGQNQPKPNTDQTIKRSQMIFGNLWLMVWIPFQS